MTNSNSNSNSNRRQWRHPNPNPNPNATGADMTLSYIDTDGNRTDNLTPAEAMALHAEHEFKGQIVAPQAPETAQDATEPTQAPNGREELPGEVDKPLTAPESKPEGYSVKLTPGDDCPECTGKIIRGRSGFGCSNYKAGCDIHKRIREDGRYFGAPGGPNENQGVPGAPTSITTPAPTISSATIPAASAIEVATTYKPGEVDPEAAARVNDQRAFLEAQGFKCADTLYAPGSQVVAMGHENFQSHKRDLDAMLPIVEECQQKAQIIKAEDRRGHITRIKDLRFNGRHLVLPSGESVVLETNALKSWASVRSASPSPTNGIKVAIAPSMAYTQHSSVDELGAMFEARKEHAAFVEKKTGRAQRLQLLTRQVGPGDRSVYAVVSPTYRYYGGDRFLQRIAAIAQRAGAGIKGEVIYDQSTTRVTGEFWHMPDHIPNLAAGDVFQVGLKFRTGDNGSTSHTIDAAILRNLCLNLLILDRATLNLMKRRHSGKAGSTDYRLNREMNAAFHKALAMVSDFRERYGWMKEQTVGDIFGTDDTSEIIRDVLTNPRPKAAMKPWSLMAGLPAEIQRDVLVEALFSSVEETAAETGLSRIIRPTYADLINIVTRAHDKVPVLASSGDSVADHLARRAGEMVTAFEQVMA